ncbi:MAG TPA: hypothetical protein VG271_12210 [Beijerinckiaceae bacterium]|nr:hypothetical protein [Beijerinckiaceae bacterium]
MATSDVATPNSVAILASAWPGEYVLHIARWAAEVALEQSMGA